MNDAPSQNGTDRVTTRDLWAVSCAQRSNFPITDGPNEGFIVTTPNGVTYTFDQGFMRAYAPLERPADTSVAGTTATVDRSQMWLMPTKVKDRFGNSVAYTYANDNFNGVVLTKIQANDGRTLNINYSGGKVQTVVDGGGRTWTYSYTGTPSRLNKVLLPDGSSWTMDFNALDGAEWDYTAPTCTSLPTASLTGDVTATITHPTGAHGVFTFNVTRHGRHGAPTTCLTNSANVAFAPKEPAVYDVLSLAKKVITGPNITSQTWTLDYAGCSSTSCNTTTTTTLTNARSKKTLMTFGAEYGADGAGNEGMLLHRQSGGSGTYPKDETFGYFAASGHAYPAVLGTPAQVRGDVSQLTSLRPVSFVTTTVDGATYTRTMSNLDSYGFPTTISHAGSATKTDTLTYSHNTNDWVLGTVKTVTSGGKTELDLGMTVHSQPTTITRFGHLDRTYGYNGDGTLLSVLDANGHTTTFTSYSYGIPRTINYPNSTSESVSVNALGKIISHTDPMSLTTSYGYDTMGRLHSITPPGSYAATTIDWSTGAGGWSRTITTGTGTGKATTTDTYDAYLHSTHTTDSAGRDVHRTFDEAGNMTYQSYPTGTRGITSVYDGLDRVLTQTDDQNNAIIYDYQTNGLAVTDRNGHQTTYKYLTYDGPSTAWPTTVTTPAGLSASTTIHRDLWGKPTSIVRGSITRSMTYDASQRLHTLTEPETGTTTFDLDDGGNITTVTYADSVVETRSYDARNRMTGVTYSDGAPALTLTWKNDGQPDTASRGGTTRSWSYNGGGLLSGESVVIDGTTYALGYDYDTNGHLQTLTYPDTTSISFTPDAFGRPSKAGTYATAATYYENDALNTFTYGNGITHSLTQYDNELPKLVKDTNVISSTYAFDSVGNPTSITDTLDAVSRSRTLTYDTSDRLKTAKGPWGTATLTYDDLDNLKTDSSTGLSLTFGATSNLPTTGTWDSRGRLSQKGSGATLTNYTFDGSNLLTKVVQGGATWNYAYDALGYRTHTDGNGATTASVYDSGGRLLYEASATVTVADRIFQNGFEAATAPSTATKYVYLGSHLVAKARTTNGTTQVLYQHTDAMGTPLVQTDASKTVVGTSIYQPYGGLYGYSGNGNEIGPGYANQYGDPTGLIYMHARYYDTSLHRFISADPNPVDTNSAGNFNRYAYANNNPFRFYDPSGRCSSTDVPDAEDTAGSCQQTPAPSSSLPSAGEVLNAVDMTFAQMGPIGLEASGVERAGEALAEEVAEAAPSALEGVQSGIVAFEDLATATRVAAGERAAQIADMLGKSKDFITIGVTETEEGVRIVSSSEKALRPAALQALQEGELAVTGLGHAEITGVNAARELGLTPTGTAASRSICPECAEFLYNEEIEPLTRLK